MPLTQLFRCPQSRPSPRSWLILCDLFFIRVHGWPTLSWSYSRASSVFHCSRLRNQINPFLLLHKCSLFPPAPDQFITFYLEVWLVSNAAQMATTSIFLFLQSPCVLSTGRIALTCGIFCYASTSLLTFQISRGQQRHLLSFPIQMETNMFHYQSTYTTNKSVWTLLCGKTLYWRVLETIDQVPTATNRILQIAGDS